MKPAISVLIFTVSSGAGYGLLMWMLFFQLLSAKAVDISELLSVGLIGLALVTLGLLSSTLHLANPKNAWRAFNRFRTSWLSREGVFALLFYPCLLAYALAVWLNDGQISGMAAALSILSMLVALLTVICTGMIYASLKPIRQWHNRYTTPLYILFSLCSGVLLLLLIKYWMTGELDGLLLNCFFVSIVASAIGKFAYFRFIGAPDGATINTATGFSQAQVRLLDAGHNADTFLTKEFVFDAGALKLVRLRKLMVLLAFIAPTGLLVLAVYQGFSPLSYLALASLFAGLLLERWLFFAEARHVVRLYHGDQRT